MLSRLIARRDYRNRARLCYSEKCCSGKPNPKNKLDRSARLSAQSTGNRRAERTSSLAELDASFFVKGVKIVCVVLQWQVTCDTHTRVFALYQPYIREKKEKKSEVRLIFSWEKNKKEKGPPQVTCLSEEKFIIHELIKRKSS